MEEMGDKLLTERPCDPSVDNAMLHCILLFLVCSSCLCDISARFKSGRFAPLIAANSGEPFQL